MDLIPEDSRCFVEIKDGPICGYIDENDVGKFYKFKGIPYAKPPIGKLRFLPPFPIQSWNDIIDCTRETFISLDVAIKEAKITEDCLYIDVVSPNIRPKVPMPVMFWMGNYSFSYTIDMITDPSLINNQEIVFVRCGYRLGPFGFLSVNDYTAPGNCGLKDLILALKWVQKNISFFGGDPENVTIFGSSTGAAVVHLMMLSPMATGLFHKAIIQSGCALNNWAMAKKPSQAVIELANELGIENTSIIEIVEELRLIPADDIIAAFESISNKATKVDKNDIIDSIFKPCIEVDLEGQPAFITKNPLSVIKSGNFNKVPLIIGSNNVEAEILQYIKKDFYDDYEKFNKNICLLLPRLLAAEDKLSKSVGHELLKFYLGGDESLREDTRTPYLQLITDYYFLFYTNLTVKMHRELAPECPIYYYILSSSGEWSVPEKLNFFNSPGHCAEIPYLFRIKMIEICKGSRDSVTTRNKMIKMWTNFAKTGNPTPDDDDPLLQITWDPVESKEKLNYLSIGSELTKGRNPFHERMQFWEALHEEHTYLRVFAYLNDLGVSW